MFVNFKFLINFVINSQTLVRDCYISKYLTGLFLLHTINDSLHVVEKPIELFFVNFLGIFSRN